MGTKGTKGMCVEAALQRDSFFACDNTLVIFFLLKPIFQSV